MSLGGISLAWGLPWAQAHLQMSLSSVGTNSPDSVSSVAKPPMAYRVPARLTRLSELRSWGKASKGAHLVGRKGREGVCHPGASAAPAPTAVATNPLET